MRLVGGRQAGRDGYWVLTRMTTTNDKLSFVASGCHVADSDVATCCRTRLPAGAGDVALGGRCCMLGRVMLVMGGGWLVCGVGAMGDVVWLPRRCGRRGTWWALVHSMTWRGGIVLERHMVFSSCSCCVEGAVVVEGAW